MWTLLERVPNFLMAKVWRNRLVTLDVSDVTTSTYLPTYLPTYLQWPRTQYTSRLNNKFKGRTKNWIQSQTRASQVSPSDHEIANKKWKISIYLSTVLKTLHTFIFRHCSLQLTVNIVQYKFCWWQDSNCGPLVYEATNLPTESQPRPKHCISNDRFVLHS